ncbi:DNA-deoxyinosine glycosylase [Nitrosomonas communis]|uniref:Hypoxanthine-DNA glycosylase n=1 Tax=Nitrosomonas communis TaxID=44574 RepID=A0A1H2XMX8_9PROT|nr:DNA-deoxyinosine glycosylase [Nitrosomonas communis]SDW93659.1 hypoxanthine-DNA glycosylase [Nitrosomonas communis]
MTRIYSFAPIADEHAEVLILGSMPGIASLAAGQYYAHKQNVFWRIMAELLSFDPAISYADKVQVLKSARIALWDVLHSCKRDGSLDAKIEIVTQIANDFENFFRGHRNITHLFFNGTKAEISFKQLVMPRMKSNALCYSRLPSTSPANASISFEGKLKAWQAILKPIGMEPNHCWWNTERTQ